MTAVPKMELVFTTEATDPGKAAKLKDGMPVFLIDGVETTVNYQDLRARLSAANHEAQERREALVAISEAVGFEGGIGTKDGLELFGSFFAGFHDDKAELKTLKSMQDAGQLDATAKDKIQEAAAAMRESEVQELNTQITGLTASASAAEERTKAAMAERDHGITTAALSRFYDNSKVFREGAQSTFAQVAKGDHGGFSWRPDGNCDEMGNPTIALMDANGVSRKGPDAMTNMTLEAWADGPLRKTNPVLFQPPAGSPPGIKNGNGPGVNKSPGEMTSIELNNRAREAYATSQASRPG